MHMIKPTLFKQFLSLLISFLFVSQPIMAAEIIVDHTRTRQHTSVDSAANGTPVVNIARPNTNGVSHNTYIQFNVPTQGTILNNSGQEVNTQLAGYIYGNENVRDGSASLILNEVSGTNRSHLNGYLEVAGQRADIIVANPNGVTVNGAGFINIPKATLTTGKVSFSGSRPIFDIEGGDIFIDGKGLDARATSSLELYTQAIKLNAKLYANDLQVVTGLNHIDTDGTVTSTDSSGKERPKFSIDSTALGGIYANAISLVGTQKGVGVNLPSEMLVQDRLEISADGQIILGKVSVRNKANIRSNSSSIEIKEGVHAATLDLQALTDISLHGNTGAITNLTLLGDNLYNDGLIAAGVNADFTQARDGLLNLGFTQSINNEGVFYGLNGTTIDTKNFINVDQAELITKTLVINAVETLHNAGELRANLTTLNTQTLSNVGLIHANDVMSITAENFDNSQGTVEGLNSVTLNISNGFLNNSGILFSDNILTLTTSTLSNTDGSIQANETLTVSASGDIDNTRGTLYSSTGTTVTAQRLNNEEGFIGSIKAVFLDLFNLNGDNGSISGEGVTIHASNIHSNNATILSSGGLNIESIGDVTLTNSAMLANSELNLIAKETTLDGSTLYSAHDTVNISSTTLQAQNAYLEANQTLAINASQYVNISDSTMRGNTVQVSTEQDVTVNNANIMAGDDLSINAQRLNLNNASLFTQDTGTINTGIFNNSDSVVSATEMNINTTTFNNANSNLYSGGGTLNINTTGILNNYNGLISANGNLVLDVESLDNRNGDLEAGNTLDVTSSNLQIASSRFFAGDNLAVTSNISNIDANTKFLSSNSMDLDFAGNLIHHGEILANGTGNIYVHGDLSNESEITANHSLNIVANTLNNNVNNTGASIRGGYLSTLMLNGDLNNYGFLTSSGNLEITATEINNYAGIAAAFDLTLNGTDLYNYHTLVSGTEMHLYISNVLRNNEYADIYAGNNLIIARDDTGEKSNKVENISARIESQGDMRILATDISNISATEIITTLQEINGVIDITCGNWGSFSCPEKNIALEIDLMAIKANIIQEYADSGVMLSDSELLALLTEQMIKNDRQAYILNMYKDTQTTADALYFYELTASLESNEMIVKRTKPHKKEEFRKVDYTVTKAMVDATSLANHKEGQIISGHNLALEADTITNKTSLIAASNDIDLRGDLANIGVRSTEFLETTINYSWKRKSDGGRGQLPISKFEIRDIDGVSSQILAGGTLTGNFGVLQNGMEADTSVSIDPNAPTISTSTQTTDETQQNATNIDTNFNTPNVDQDAIESTPLALTPRVYDPSTNALTLPNNPYGLFVTSEDPDGPLIETNPEYTNYNNYVSSDYLLDRLGYDGSSKMRRLGDALYETQLIRDAIIAMTGQRYIGNAQNDKDQYTNLMNAGVNYAREVGLELGVPPTSLQLKNLKEDLVWMEEKSVQGKQVLVPVLYLAKEYNNPTGANLAANSMKLTVDRHLNNSGNMQTRQDMTLRTGTLTNAKGNIETGSNMNVSAVGDIQNLSGSIKGGSVVLSSTQGNIVNKTVSKGLDLQHSVGIEHYTVIDKTASIEAKKGSLVLESAKNINNIGAELTSKGAMVLKAKEDINLKTLKDEKSYDYTLSNGYAKGESVDHVQSSIKAGKQLSLLSDKSTNLEAVNIEAKDVFIDAKGKTNVTAVVDSKYVESHYEDDGFLSSSSTTDMNLVQAVKGTNIETGNLVVEGNDGVSLESIVADASSSVQITSKEGDVDFKGKAYTNAEYHEESSSILGGLFSERSIDAKSETLLSSASTKAENNIIVDGKNVHLMATDLETNSGGIKLSATDNVNIVSGMEARSEEHIREKSGLSLGYSSGRITFAEETTDSTQTTNYTNKASTIKTNTLLLESGQDTNVIASNITSGVMRVDAARDFNVLSDKDITLNNEEHSKKEIGVEFTLTSREASVFAGYWEDETTQSSTQSQIASSNIAAGALDVNSQNTNVAGSNIAGEDITINSENIRILSDSTNSNTDTYTKSIKAGVEVGARQNLSTALDAIVEVGEAQSGSAVVARSLQAYDAVQSFSEQPVKAGVTALYEESNTDSHSTNSQVVSSSVTATNSLTINAIDKLEIAGSDVSSFDTLTIDADNINIHASQGTYTTETSSETRNTNVGLYGTNTGQATIGYLENEMTTEGTYQRNSQLYAGGTASIISTGDTTLNGVNVDSKDLALNVGKDLHMESLQDTQTIDGSSRGGSISGNVLTGTPTGASANAGETSGERAWVSQITGINGSESITVNIGGTMTLAGASITNHNAEGVEQNNLEVNTQHLVANDIKDIDTYDATTAGLGLNNGEGNTPKLNSVEYTNNTTDKEQITRATIGSGSINAGSTTGIVNRDTTNSQEITKDEESNTEIYESDRTLALLDDPEQEIARLSINLRDIPLTAYAEIQDNLPSITEIAEEGTVLHTILDYASFTNVIPTKENDGGYISQIATQLFGDNRAQLNVMDESVLQDLGLYNRINENGKEIANWDYEAYTRRDGSTGYRTNPDRAITIVADVEKVEHNPNERIDAMRIYVNADDVRDAGINHVFTNGLNNTSDEALNNQQQQQGLPETALLNYNQTHGIVGDLLETGLERLTIALDDVPGVQSVGYVFNGSARNTGDTIAQLSQINNGNLHVAAHSQGTQQTYLGLQQQQENIANDLRNNPISVFTLQNSGAPISSVAAQELVVDGLYGGEDNIKIRFDNEDGTNNVFRSQVNPGDPVSILGGNFGGVNNNSPIYTSGFWSEAGYTMTRGATSLMGGTIGERPSPHSGYECVIGCAEGAVVPVDVEYYYDTTTNQSRPLTEFYDTIHVDSSHSNVNGGSTITQQIPVQIGIGVNK